MNERIKELAEQAGFMVDQSGTIMVCFTSTGDSEVKKFAELIVAECIEQCNINFVGTVGTHSSAHNRGVKKCIDNIKQHFGVEE